MGSCSKQKYLAALVKKDWEAEKRIDSFSQFHVDPGYKKSERVQAIRKWLSSRCQPIPPSAPMFWYCSTDDRSRLPHNHVHMLMMDVQLQYNLPIYLSSR